MIALGFLVAVVLWLLAAYALSSYEIDVRVLSPRVRAAYGAVAFLAGLVLWALIAGWRPR
jgi:hypothetical protein